MLYRLELGSIEQGITAQSANMGRKTPHAIANKPLIDPGNELYYNAFQTLDGERHIGMSIGRIPWSAVQRYADHYEFDPEQTDILHMAIQSMDAVHLNHISSSLEKGKHGKSK